MTKININSGLIYNEIERYLDYAKRDFENIISINNEISYYSNFEEGRNLQNFINDGNNLRHRARTLEDWANYSRKKIEQTVYNLEEDAGKLPYREIPKRKGLL